MELKIRTITLVQGDRLLDLLFVAKDLDGVVMNIVDSSVVLRCQAYDFKENKALASGLAWELTGTVTDGPNGKFQVQVPEVDLDPIYSYLAEVEVTYLGGRVVTAPLVRIDIIKQLPI